ncbi:MAG TPA: beta-ketoacyl-ACP synthase II [Chloroflexota bacterium]|nr:beta-ketoacyl-ACP synthase II [Chloroflexota bacterium]
MGRRVVITGLGCVSPLANDVSTTWCGIKAGRSGIGRITHFDASRLPVQIAGEVKDFDPTAFLERKEARRMDRFQQLAFAATVEALRSSGLEITSENAERVGVVVGSGVGGLGTLTDGFRTLFERGPGRVSPFLITQMVVDLAPGMISIILGAKGPNFSTVSACATGAHAIGEAAEIIRRGQADVMLAGGAEAGVVEIGMAAFANMRALSTRNDEPERASRPFDAERDGFILSEGAGIVTLEELEYARRRGATILAELVGYGQTADAFHITEPAAGGEGAARAMAEALSRARMAPEEIKYLNAHGTSTTVGDSAESAAIKTVFGEYAMSLPVSSTKSMTGHLLGAAGGVESIFSVLAMRDDFIPPTINYENPDPSCDLDYVPNEGRTASLDAVMSNSFGFGGHNVSLIFRKLSG